MTLDLRDLRDSGRGDRDSGAWSPPIDCAIIRQVVRKRADVVRCVSGNSLCVDQAASSGDPTFPRSMVIRCLETLVSALARFEAECTDCAAMVSFTAIEAFETRGGGI